MRSDHAHFRSLNSAIQSVTNPQPKVVKEERAVDDTSFAVERGNKKKKWKISGGGNAVGFDALRAAIERRKIYKSRNSRATVKEDIQTSEREQEMSGKRKKLEKRFETSAMLPKDSLGIWAHGKKDAAEKKEQTNVRQGW